MLGTDLNMISSYDSFDNFSIVGVTLLACFVSLLVAQYSGYLVSGTRLSNPKDPEACRKLGLEGRSNLEDEHSPSHSGSQPDSSIWRVKSLWIYPIKSCKGVELENSVTVGTGLEFDRQFAFARWTKVSKGEAPLKMGWKFLTQRDAPLMATIQPEIWVPDHNSHEYSDHHPNVRSAGMVRIRYTTTYGGKTKIVDFPYKPTMEQTKTLGFRTTAMTIWKDSPDSLLLASTENHDRWIEEIRTYLGVKTPFALFRVKSMQSRKLFRNAPRVDEIGFQPTVGFQDAYPLHILNLASVQDIASRFQDGIRTLSARNFRPNIIISGGDAYAEDSWKRVTIGYKEYFTSCRTVRCLLPNVDQDSGKKHESEPNKTLKLVRKIDPGKPQQCLLGNANGPCCSRSSDNSSGR